MQEGLFDWPNAGVSLKMKRTTGMLSSFSLDPSLSPFIIIISVRFRDIVSDQKNDVFDPHTCSSPARPRLSIIRKDSPPQQVEQRGGEAYSERYQESFGGAGWVLQCITLPLFCSALFVYGMHAATLL